MRRTGYVYAQRYQLHDPGSWHPERPDRLRAIHNALKEDDLLELLVLLRPDYAPLEWVERLHDPEYIKRFKEACEQGRQIFMVQDCGICKESYQTACWPWAGSCWRWKRSWGAGGQRLLRRAAAGASRRAGPGHGVLLFQ